MNGEQALSWSARRAGSKARAGLAARVRCLEERLSGSGLELDFFEAAVDTERGLGRVKLVHVARAVRERPLRPKEIAALARLRERTLVELFAMTPGLEARDLRSLYDGLKRAGVAELFLPVISVECDARTGEFGEISLYCDEGHEPLVAPLAAALGAAAPRGPISALGCDFRPGGEPRLKLYRPKPWDQIADTLERRTLAALPPSLRSQPLLTLARRPRGGAWERPRKLYVPFIERASPAEAVRVAALRDGCAPGPVKDFLAGLAADGAGGHVVDYLGCEGTRVEAYIGQPYWRGASAASKAAIGGGEW